MKYEVIEVTGWNAEGESVSVIAHTRDNETRCECIRRIIREENIVEVGEVR